MNNIIDIPLRAGVPVLLLGEPGSGKTSHVRAVAHQAGRHVEVLLGGCISEPSDIMGIPVMNDRKYDICPPAWWRRLQDGPSVLFLDELTCAPQWAQAALLRLVAERSLHGETLVDTWIIAAANPSDQGGYELSAPMASRFCHLQWQVAATDWARQYVHGWETPSVGRDAGVDLLPRERRLMSSFILRRPALLTSESCSGPYASPRTWDYVARCAAAAGGALDETIVAGLVGGGPAAEYCKWRSAMDLPHPDEVMAGRWTPDARPERTLAIIESVAPLVRDADTWAAAWRELARVSGLDVQALGASIIAPRRPAGAAAPAWVGKLKGVVC